MDRPSELMDGVGALKILREEIKARPYRTIGIAAGVGFVLGSGLGRAIVALLSSRIGRELGAAILAPSLAAISTRGARFGGAEETPKG